MTIENSDKVDGIGIDRQNGEAILMISDHLPWPEEDMAHFLLLESKLENYIDFVRSGQITEIIPQSSGMPVRIKLVYEFEPTARAKALLEDVSRQLCELDIRFSFDPLPQGY